MRVARGWREGPERDERETKESEMIRKRVGERERKCEYDVFMTAENSL